MECKCAVDLANNWMVGGQTRHGSLRDYFLHELKDEDVVAISFCWAKKVALIFLLKTCST